METNYLHMLYSTVNCLLMKAVQANSVDQRQIVQSNPIMIEIMQFTKNLL